MNKSNKVYIYNKDQALFYMQKGLLPLDIGVHSRTNKPFWCFNYQDHRKFFGAWINKNK